MKRVVWIILLLVFVLALAACGGDEPESPTVAPVAQVEPAVEEEAVAEATAVPDEPVQEEAPAEEAEPAAQASTGKVSFGDLKISGLDELTSYRYDMLIDIIGVDAEGVENTQSMHMELAVNTDPPATSVLMTASGTDAATEMGNMEFVQIEDTSYIVMAEMGCMALPAEGEGAMSTKELTQNFTPESITKNLADVNLVGEETIDGIEVLHYTYDETSMDSADLSGAESVDGHLYVAKEGGYLVRSIVDMVGTSPLVEGMGNDAFKSVTTHVEMNLTDVNEAVEIVMPAACEGQGAAENAEWPMTEDASEVFSFAGVTTYSSALSGQEVIDFYNGAMAELGFTQDENGSFVSDGTGMLTFVNENDESVTITISEDPATGLTAVTVMSETAME